MALWQKIAAAVLVVALILVMIVTWGSMGSAAIGFALVMAGAGILYQHFMNRDDPYGRDYFE